MKLDAIVTELPTCHKHNCHTANSHTHIHTQIHAYSDKRQTWSLLSPEWVPCLRKKQQVELNWRKRDIKRERRRGREAVLLFVSFCEQLLLIYVDFLGRSWTSLGSGKHKLKDFFDNPWNYDTYYLSKRIRKTVLGWPRSLHRYSHRRRLCATARQAPHKLQSQSCQQVGNSTVRRCQSCSTFAVGFGFISVRFSAIYHPHLHVIHLITNG